VFNNKKHKVMSKENKPNLDPPKKKKVLPEKPPLPPGKKILTD